MACYQSLIDHPLPLREEAVRQISSRSMAIDFYVWLAYRLHALSEPLAVPWAALKGQFGQSYNVARKFRRDATTNLALALAVYPMAQVVIDDKDGLPLPLAPAGPRAE